MLIDYISNEFITLMILSSLAAVMYVNRKEKLPTLNLLRIAMILLFVITVVDEGTELAARNMIPHADLSRHVRLSIIFNAVSYILRPVIVMLEVLMICPDKKYRPLIFLPTAVNTCIFSTAFFGSRIAFYINDDNTWGGGPLHSSIFITQVIYVLMLLIFSVSFFKKENKDRTFIVLVIFLQSVIVALLEYHNIITGYANQITALGILEYYIYITLVYQQEMRDIITQKEIDIARSNLLVLRNQIQPHFIYNTLSIIRSLARRDGRQAVKCIDTFSTYLKSHIGAIRSDDLIPFRKELENAKVYLSLVQIDYTNKVEVVYELETTDFLIPPLSLEPIVENAVDHGISRGGGRLTIHTHEDKAHGNIIISISDNGTSRSDTDIKDYTPLHNGVGIENTRKRLEIQCGGGLELNISESGAEAVITLPKERVGTMELS